jgi:hypothetical protein
LQSIRLTHHLIRAEIDKQLFDVRDGVFRVFQYEFYSFLIREFPRVDDISGSLLIRVMVFFAQPPKKVYFGD